MAIPAFFKVVSEISKAKSIASGDVSSAVSKGIGKKFNPDKRIEVQKNENRLLEGNKKFDPDKRIKQQGDLKNETTVTEKNSTENKELVSKGELYTKAEDRRNQALGSKGEWRGEEGKSEFVPEKQAARDSLSEYGEDSIRYDENYEPDFSKVSEASVKIDNMTENRYGKGNNFNQADNKLAQKWNSETKDGRSDWTARDVDNWVEENGLTRHERLDKETVDYVKTSIHEECKHYGGCAECKVRDALADKGVRFDE